MDVNKWLSPMIPNYRTIHRSDLLDGTSSILKQWSSNIILRERSSWNWVWLWPGCPSFTPSVCVCVFHNSCSVCVSCWWLFLATHTELSGDAVRQTRGRCVTYSRPVCRRLCRCVLCARAPNSFPNVCGKLQMSLCSAWNQMTLTVAADVDFHSSHMGAHLLSHVLHMSQGVTKIFPFRFGQGVFSGAWWEENVSGVGFAKADHWLIWYLCHVTPSERSGDKDSGGLFNRLKKKHGGREFAIFVWR